MFTEMLSHYLFADRSGRPGKGNDKGNVEGLMEARHARQGRREFVQVPRLLESFDLPVLCAAMRVALQKRVIAFDAIKHLVLCQVERRSARLDLSLYPCLPRAKVTTTRPSNYMALLSEGAS